MPPNSGVVRNVKRRKRLEPERRRPDMHPRMQELLDHLAHFRSELRSAVDEIPRDKLTTKPAPDRWSVAEVLEHLSMVETRVCDRFSKALEAAHAQGLAKESE